MSTPETLSTAELQVMVDFFDAWRYCPVASSSKPSRSCLESAGTQLLDALDIVRAPVDAERERLMKENTDLTAWASVGRHGVCVHSVTVEDCAGCANRNLRRERERLLDVLEDALLWLERIPPPEEEVRALGRGLWDETLEKAQDVLREYGRLGDRRPGA